MEKILRSEEMAEIILLPVRHHSPACAFHVSRAIESIRPSVILVEGPEPANSLMEVMTHEDTEAPFAIYYSYHDQSGRISEEKEHYKCYYPFLDYSPELAALREGKRLGIKAAFIDLPYGDILAASNEGRGLLNRDAEKNNYNDDHYLSQNEYLRQLCEKTGLRSFDEFWEKYFELNGLHQEDGIWFSNLLTYCSLARDNSKEEELKAEGCLARERYMADRIAEYAKAAAPENDTILVVTGGFHTPALKALLTGGDAGEKQRQMPEGDTGRKDSILPPQGAEEEKQGQVSGEGTGRKDSLPLQDTGEEKQGQASGEDTGEEKRGQASAEDTGRKDSLPSSQDLGEKHREGKVPEKDQGVYLMPYSMEAADALNGYASGMPFPGFYQNIWENLGETDTPYSDVVLDLIVASGKETRRKEGYLSTYDEICACAMAGGLAQLRGKQEPGAYELLDAVLSSFVKGEYNLASDTPMRILRKRMTGKGVGKLCAQADVPPIIHDFETECRKFKLKTVSTLESESTLSIFSNKKHRQESMFFHRMGFLDTTFARKIKGPNLQLKRDKNLMREIWKYKWNAQVNSALIDVSVYGATIEEAASGLVKEKLSKDMGAKEGAVLLTHVFEMGLAGQLQSVYDRVHELMLQDTDFYSLAEALRSLMMMEELGELYESRMAFGSLIHIGCRKLIGLLPSMTRIKDEDLAPCMTALKLLYQITGRDSQEQSGQGKFAQERESYYDALVRMNEDGQIHAGLNGCIHGILYGSGRETASEVEMACRGYLTGTGEQLFHTAQFFKGLFFTARDLVFIGDEFLKMLDTFFGQVTAEEFMELLPELRMAFTYFTPRETDKIAAMAAKLHGTKQEDILRREVIMPDWYSYGAELDEYVRGKMAVQEECAFQRNTVK